LARGSPLSHRRAPDVPVYYLSITPTRARWRHWPIAQEANRLVEQYTLTEARVRFIDLTAAILGPDGQPDRTLYRIDRLHPNKKDYAAWAAVIKPILEADLRQSITNC
jgi:lysophospholipase L1-like esterase